MVIPSLVRWNYLEYRITEKFKKTLHARINNALYVGADIVRDAAKKLAPKHIGDHIKISGITQSFDPSNLGIRYVIKIYVPIKEAPDAAAWEYGSGLHRTRTTPGKYPIDAKNYVAKYGQFKGMPVLIFWWEKRSRLFVGPHVNHPGIVARPYLLPALMDNVDRILLEFESHV